MEPYTITARCPVPDGRMVPGTPVKCAGVKLTHAALGQVGSVTDARVSADGAAIDVTVEVTAPITAVTATWLAERATFSVNCDADDVD